METAHLSQNNTNYQNPQNLVNDIFETEFLNAKNALINCQNSKNLKSCLNCPSIFECPTRENYVTSVYKKMNKGESGSFDFN